MMIESQQAVADLGGGGIQGPQKLRAIHTKYTTNTVLTCSMQTHRFT